MPSLSLLYLSFLFTFTVYFYLLTDLLNRVSCLLIHHRLSFSVY